MRENKGMTLVECLVALTLLAVGMVALVSAISTGAEHIKQGTEMDVLHDQMKQVIEKIDAKQTSEGVTIPSTMTLTKKNVSMVTQIVGSTNVSVPGIYYELMDKDTEWKYSIFIPNA